MRKITILLPLITILLSFTCLNVFAADQEKYVYDRADLFSDPEIEAIESEARKYFGASYASIYIVTDDSDYVSYYGDHFISEYKVADNCIILIITANSRHNYDLYTYGKCYYKISNAEVDYILDHDGVYGNIKNGRYYEGAMSFISLASESCETDRSAVVGLTVTLSLISGAIVIISVIASYKRKSRSDKYPLNRYCKLDLTRERDDFRGSFVTHRTINSGGGKGGRSGGGGGSGHRGGR